MTKVEAVSEVFITALRALPKKEKTTILEKLFADREFRDDITDIVLTWERRKEKTIPYENIRAELKKTGRL